jgi:hypothetical protein
MAEKWIQGAINPAHKGLLHRELHVAEGKTIPHSKIVAAEHSRDPSERKRAFMADTLAHMPHPGKAY